MSNFTLKVKVKLQYLVLGFEVLLFIFVVVVAMMLFTGWGYEPISDAKRGSYVEISLPLLEWSKYTNLSKARNNDILP